jgi:uncharacterized membrane protein
MIKQIILSAIIMLILDLVYLSTLSGFYNTIIKNVQGEKISFNIIGAIIAYLCLIYGINYFILNKPKTSLVDAFILGIVIYGTYEGTNYAIIKKWSPYAVLIDTLWGGILFTLVTYFTRKIMIL